MKFLPLCNPSQAIEISKRIPTFTEAQLEKYEKRYAFENADPDEHYQQWLATYHPNHCSSGKAEITSSSTETVLIPAPSSSAAYKKVISNQHSSTQMPAVKVNHMVEC